MSPTPAAKNFPTNYNISPPLVIVFFFNTFTSNYLQIDDKHKRLSLAFGFFQCQMDFQILSKGTVCEDLTLFSKQFQLKSWTDWPFSELFYPLMILSSLHNIDMNELETL